MSNDHDSTKPEAQEQVLTPEHAERFKDLVRRSLSMKATDSVKQEEREYDRQHQSDGKPKS
jgi:hypothetical protein